MDLNRNRSGPPTSIFELGVEEAYRLLADRFGMTDLPPLEAIENEDWGRDLLLSRFQQLSEARLHDSGLTWDDAGESAKRSSATDRGPGAEG